MYSRFMSTWGTLQFSAGVHTTTMLTRVPWVRLGLAKHVLKALDGYSQFGYLPCCNVPMRICFYTGGFGHFEGFLDIFACLKDSVPKNT